MVRIILVALLLCGAAHAEFDPETGTVVCDRWASGVPLGGIGVGKVELLTDGSLGGCVINHNWDRPTGWLRGAFIGVRARQGEGQPVARMLRLPCAEEYEGVSNIARTYYKGFFPQAQMYFEDPELPVLVRMLAWSPLIPHNVDDSALPIACFQVHLRPMTTEDVDVALVFSWENLLGWGGDCRTEWNARGAARAEYCRVGGTLEGLRFSTTESFDDRRRNTVGEYLLLADTTEGVELTCCPVWESSGPTVPFWGEFTADGVIEPHFPAGEPTSPAGAISASLTLTGGKSRMLIFWLVWDMPTHVTEHSVSVPAEGRERSEAGVETAFDGDPATRWATERPMVAGDAFVLDMGRARELTRLRMRFPPRVVDYPRLYSVDSATTAGDEGPRWERVISGGKPEFTAAWEWSVDLPPGPTRFLRITVEQPNGHWWWSIAEMEADAPSGEPVPREGWSAYAQLRRMEERVTREDVSHWYRNRFSSADEVALYAQAQMHRLYEETIRGQGLVMGSNLPFWLKLKAVNSLFPLYACTVLTRDGRFTVQESPGHMCGALGTMDQRMASHGIYTMWFPELDRSELSLFARAQDLVLPHADGRIPHFCGNVAESIGDPNVGYGVTDWPDLSSSFVMQVVKHYRWTGDRAFFEEMWPHVRRALEWLQSADEDGDLLPEGGSTYDYEQLPRGAFVFNASCYLGALKAGAWAAEAAGEPALRDEYADRFGSARASMVELLWNGEYFDKWTKPGTSERNPNCFIAQLAGDWLARYTGLGRVFEPRMARSCVEQIIARNVNAFRPVPPMEVTRSGESPLPMCYVIQHEPYIGCEAIYEGYGDDGLEVIRRVYKVAWELNLSPWDQMLDYTAPTGVARGLRSYMTCPATWHVLHALAGSSVDLPDRTLYLSPHRPGQMEALHIPLPFSTFTAWLDYIPGELLQLRVMKVHRSEPAIFERVLGDPEGEAIYLAEPFYADEGAVLDLTEHMGVLVPEPEPRRVVLKYDAKVDERQGIPARQWWAEYEVSNRRYIPAHAKAAFDGLRGTRWSTDSPMRPGDRFEVNMRRAYNVERVVFDSSTSPDDWPRGFILEVSMDGRDWRAVAQASAEECEAQAHGGVLSIELEPVRARRIRITQTGSHETLFWSIHEMYVYEAAE